MKQTTLFLLLLFSLYAGGRTFSANPVLKSALVAYCITDANGTIIAEKNKETALVPASTLKLLTTATAIEQLGRDLRFETTLGYTGHISPEGILKGNIYILGKGDPTLGSNLFPKGEAFMEDWLEALRKKGIRKVEGDIIADDRYFDTQGISPHWLYEDTGNYYAAGTYGINIFDNTYKLYLQSFKAGDPIKVLRSEPLIDNMKWVSYAVAADNRKDSIYLQGMPFYPLHYLYGTMPAHQSEFCVKGAIPDPPLFLASWMKKKMQFSQITVEGEPLTARILSERGEKIMVDTFTVLARTYSPPLIDIARIVNQRSHNLYAETLLRQLAVSDGKKGSRKQAIDVLKHYWMDKHIAIDGQEIVDGCGLSRLNTVSPLFFVKVLNQMRHEEHFEEFKQTIPVIGEEGTVASLLKGTRLAGRGRAKSGSMQGVLCYAGYISEQGKGYTFAIMVNHHHATTLKVRKEIEKILLNAIPQS